MRKIKGPYMDVAICLNMVGMAGGFFDGVRKEKIALDNQTRLGYTGREVKR